MIPIVVGTLTMAVESDQNFLRSIFSCDSNLNIGCVNPSLSRSGGSTGAVGAFAPVDFQQWVQCTRPDKELSYKWPCTGAAGAFAPVIFQQWVQCTRPDKELFYK